MTTKKFVIKISIKILIFAILSVIALTLLQTPVITNKIAMGQMENSDELYVLQEMYYKMAPIIRIVYGFIAVGFAAWIGYDIYQFIKIRLEKQNEKN